MVRANPERFQTKHGDRRVFLVFASPELCVAFGRTYRSFSLRVAARVGFPMVLRGPQRGLLRFRLQAGTTRQTSLYSIMKRAGILTR